MDEQTVKTEKPVSAARKAIFILFIGFVSLFSVLLAVLPKHHGELSPNERRLLSEAPEFNSKTVLSGEFSKQADTWIQDHFPLRNVFVSIYSYANRLTGRNATEGIILGKGGRLFVAPIEKNDKDIAKSADKIRGFVENNSLNAYSAIIPSSGSMLEEELPAMHLEYREDEIHASILDGFAGSVDALDVKALFNETDDVGSLYYRTDHHLTMRGSYLIYRALGEKLGYTPLDESAFTKIGYPFYGTSYGKSGLFLTAPDTLETWVGPSDSHLTVTTRDSASSAYEHIGSLDTKCLEADVVDKYAAYLYGNHGITTIINENLESGSLLVLKDSYGNAVVPFLAEHYRTVIMIDTRSMYYNLFLPTPSKLCEEFGLRDFVIITGIDTVADGSVDLLR